jgi:hypothetical protein
VSFRYLFLGLTAVDVNDVEDSEYRIVPTTYLLTE